MVLKKPYAFLIKHFKKIHLSLLLPIFYLTFKITDLHAYFKSYVNSGWILNRDLEVVDYLGLTTFIVAIFIFVVMAFIFSLMQFKKKPKIVYLSGTLIYFGILIFLFLSYNNLNLILSENVDVRTIRALRDFAFVFIPLQYIMIVILAIRGIGFNVKKFNFEKDIEALEINVGDDEEFEVSVNFDKRKFDQTYRRNKRHFKYFAVENKRLLKFLGIVFTGLISTTLILNFFVYNPVYPEGKEFNINKFKMTALESWTTENNFKDEPIANDKKTFIIVRVLLENTTNFDAKLTLSRIRLATKYENAAPITNKNKSFFDLGEGYIDQRVNPFESNEFILIFEVTERSLDYKMLLKYTNNILISGDKEITTRYKSVKLDPKEFPKKTITELTIGEPLDFSNTVLKEGIFIVEQLEMKDFFDLDYKECIYDVCVSKVENISPNPFARYDKKVMELTTSLKGNDDIELAYDFINDLGVIKYRIDDKEKNHEVDLVNITPQGVTNEVYIEVLKELELASEIWIEFNIRNNQFKYILKKD